MRTGGGAAVKSKEGKNGRDSEAAVEVQLIGKTHAEIMEVFREQVHEKRRLKREKVEHIDLDNDSNVEDNEDEEDI